MCWSKHIMGNVFDGMLLKNSTQGQKIYILNYLYF